MNSSAALVENKNKVVQFTVVNGKTIKKEPKKTKAGEVKKTKSNKEAGVSAEVFALKSKDEISSIIQYLNQKIDDATTENKKKLAYRNKLIWLVGMNIGIRASDFLELKWSFFFDIDTDGNIEYHPYYSLQPEKQRKQKKFVKLFFNNTLKKAIEEYLSVYPITKDELDDYMFTKTKGGHITTQQLWNVICDTAEGAGIKQNVGTHTLRKTWAFHCWHDAKDKNKALIILQKCFNHSSPQTTLGYIGVLDSEVEDMYNSVELGLDDM